MLNKNNNEWLKIWVSSCFLVLITGCKTGISSPPTNPYAGIPEAHVNLLQLQTDAVIQLEKQQRYPYLYDQEASPELRQRNTRTAFLQLANCVETNLGPIKEVHQSDTKIDFFPKQSIYLVRIPLSREQADLKEWHSFLLNTDGTLDWVGVYWQSNRPDFADCVANIHGVNVWHPPVITLKQKPSFTAKKETR